MRGRLVAYIKFQLQDFLLLRAGLPTVLVLMFGFMLWKQAGSSLDWNTPTGQQFAMGNKSRKFSWRETVIYCFARVAFTLLIKTFALSLRDWAELLLAPSIDVMPILWRVWSSGNLFHAIPKLLHYNQSLQNQDSASI